MKIKALSDLNRVLPFDPLEFPRETNQHYISASNDEIAKMLANLETESLQDLFLHIPQELRFDKSPNLPCELEYNELIESLLTLSEKTNLKTSFIGDQLPVWKIDPAIEELARLRPLTTSYTPYQPERSQGTLQTHWIYQCALSALTGFEAINTSLYDRSFAIYESILCAIRTSKRPSKALLSKSLFENDIQVLETLAEGTGLEFSFVDINPENGKIDLNALHSINENEINSIACFVFPQVNALGILEEVDSLTDFCRKNGMRSIACIDPMLLASGGLKAPSDFGEHADGADFIAGDAQHLATPPSFGGPGLGIFGCRFNAQNKSDLRNSPGRYVGKAQDLNGRDCFVMVLSTREQHIRKEKATSNVCSNQAFLATLAGAHLLLKGNDGIANSLRFALENKEKFLADIADLHGVDLAFPLSPCFNEIVLEFNRDIAEIIREADSFDLQLGVDISERVSANNKRNLLKITFTDSNTVDDCEKLSSFFRNVFKADKAKKIHTDETPIPQNLIRVESPHLPSFSKEEILQYYQKLADLNVSPDEGCFPLGSCTMKYNPMINDWAAALPGFSLCHPQAPTEDAQGPLGVLYEIQEWFKTLTGLQGVTTQPVAGAQGELVGLKLFQAYHRDKGESHRDIVFIPRSAHGTNFATAAMAGYPDGIVYLEANQQGTIDMDDFRNKLEQYSSRLCGVMITNPNTSGIFERDFQVIAQQVHQAGGLVYMDGANMNAIAGIVDLGKMGVDAVHNNLHKTWTIPHGGGGPGDAIVAVSEKLLDYLPGKQIVKRENGMLEAHTPKSSIGTFHRNWGNFGHKVRALSYLYRLGKKGIPRMSSVAVLASRYLLNRLSKHFPTLPEGAKNSPRMHEFIITLSQENFEKLAGVGISKNQIIPQVGKEIGRMKVKF